MERPYFFNIAFVLNDFQGDLNLSGTVTPLNYIFDCCSCNVYTREEKVIISSIAMNKTKSIG